VKQVNIHEAKTHLSRLVEAAARGEVFVIAKAGRPLVKVVPVDAPEDRAKPRRFGFMKGQFSVPDDFDTFMQDEIIEMFEEGPLFPPLDPDKKPSDGR
jgi:prevent-host-death family protein